MEDKKLQHSSIEPDAEVIKIEDFTKEGKVPPKGKKYQIRVGNEHFTFEKEIVTGKEILTTAGIRHIECFWLYQKLKDCDFNRISPSEHVDLSEPGIEHFIIKPTEVFQYYVDTEPETTDQAELTPDQILQSAGLIPVTDYYLVRINADGSQDSFKDLPTEPIKMVCPAVKFVSAFRGETPVS